VSHGVPSPAAGKFAAVLGNSPEIPEFPANRACGASAGWRPPAFASVPETTGRPGERPRDKPSTDLPRAGHRGDELEGVIAEGAEACADAWEWAAAPARAAAEPAYRCRPGKA
jgi:hypothetical protein